MPRERHMAFISKSQWGSWGNKVEMRVSQQFWCGFLGGEGREETRRRKEVLCYEI